MIVLFVVFFLRFRFQRNYVYRSAAAAPLTAPVALVRQRDVRTTAYHSNRLDAGAASFHSAFSYLFEDEGVSINEASTHEDKRETGASPQTAGLPAKSLSGKPNAVLGANDDISGRLNPLQRSLTTTSSSEIEPEKRVAMVSSCGSLTSTDDSGSVPPSSHIAQATTTTVPNARQTSDTPDIRTTTAWTEITQQFSVRMAQGCPVRVTYTNQGHVVDEWIRNAIPRSSRGLDDEQMISIGLDIEWDSSIEAQRRQRRLRHSQNNAGSTVSDSNIFTGNAVDVLQLATPEAVLVFHISPLLGAAHSFPEELIRLFESNQLFVGVGVTEDVKKLVSVGVSIG